MSITSFKITDSDISSKGVVAAPTVLSGSPEENKRIFDRLVREVLKGDFNALVDALAATTGAGEIGAAVEGLTGETVQAILSALKTLLDSKAASADMEAALGGKSDTSVTDTHIKSVAFDAGTGVFTFTKENGTTVTVDTALEKVAVNFAYDEDTQSLVLTLADGSTQRVSLAAFLTTTEFEDSNTIEWSVSGSMVRATIKSGSITDAMLSSTLKTMLQGYVSAAANSATNAEASATNAANNATRSLGYQNAARAAAKEAEASQQEAKADADRAASASAHQPRISSDGYWELWDLTQGVYVKTTYKANGADGDPGIVISATQPTAESHPVWINPDGEASPAGGTDLSLGITGATVGQIAKITAVDDSGKPTEWGAVEFPNGLPTPTDSDVGKVLIAGEGGTAGWGNADSDIKLIYSNVLTKAVSSIIIDKGPNGNALSLSRWKVCLRIPPEFADYSTPIYMYCVDGDDKGFVVADGNIATNDISARNVVIYESFSDHIVRGFFHKYGGAIAKTDCAYYVNGVKSTAINLHTYSADKPFPVGTFVEVYGK